MALFKVGEMALFRGGETNDGDDMGICPVMLIPAKPRDDELQSEFACKRKHVFSCQGQCMTACQGQSMTVCQGQYTTVCEEQYMTHDSLSSTVHDSLSRTRPR